MFNLTTLSSIPPAARNKKRALEFTDEWTRLKAKLDSGLRPYEAAVVQFTPDEMVQYNVKTTGKVFLSMTLDYIKSKKLPLDAWKYRSEDKSEVIVVADRVALSTLRVSKSRDEDILGLNDPRHTQGQRGKRKAA